MQQATSPNQPATLRRFLADSSCRPPSVVMASSHGDALWGVTDAAWLARTRLDVARRRPDARQALEFERRLLLEAAAVCFTAEAALEASEISDDAWLQLLEAAGCQWLRLPDVAQLPSDVVGGWMLSGALSLPPGLCSPPLQQERDLEIGSMSREREYDVSKTTGIPPPYLVKTPGCWAGYKVQVWSLPSELDVVHQRLWIAEILSSHFCPLPFETEAMSGADSHVILTFDDVADAQRTRCFLRRVRAGLGQVFTQFWVPDGYNAWDEDPRFEGLPRPRR